MPNFSHILDGVIARLQPVIFVAAVVAWAAGLIGHLSTRGSGKRISPQFVAGGLIFAALIGGEFAVNGFTKRAALKEIRPKLYANIESMTVNGVELVNDPDLITALRGMHDAPAHHSEPTVSYQLLLQTERGPLTLLLRRDSQNKHEYWVYYPGFHSTQDNEVGRVFTDALD